MDIYLQALIALIVISSIFCIILMRENRSEKTRKESGEPKAEDFKIIEG